MFFVRALFGKISPKLTELYMETPCWCSSKGHQRGSYWGILVWLDDFIFRKTWIWKKLFFVISDLKVLHGHRRTWISKRYLWFYHSSLSNFETRVHWIVRVVYRGWLVKRAREPPPHPLLPPFGNQKTSAIIPLLLTYAKSLTQLTQKLGYWNFLYNKMWSPVEL